MTDEPGGDGVRRINRWRILGWGTAVLLLVMPLVAMQFSDEVDWDLSDFVIFSIMLALVGGSFELAVRFTPNGAYRAATGVALAAAFILVWINGAVGIIGNEENPANLIFLGVIAVGIVGAIITRGRPTGMAYAMVATATAQALVAVIALLAGLGYTLGVTGFFVTLWLTSAWLFRKSKQKANVNFDSGT